MDDSTPTVRVTLELSTGTGPPRGALCVDGASKVPFEGWLELAKVLEGRRQDTAAAGAAQEEEA